MVGGIADIVCLTLWILLMYVAVRKIYVWQEKQSDSDIQFFGTLIGIVVLLVISLLTWNILYNGVMAVFAPEYVVLNKLLELAIAK